MLFSPAFLSLMAGVSAIDITLNVERDCITGTNFRCNGINPNTCCSAQGWFRSVRFTSIPSSLNIEMRAYNGTRCNRRLQSRASNGLVSFCLTRGGSYSGSGYGILNRAITKTADEESIDKCTEYAKPDILTFGDGIEYNITAMEDTLLTEIVNIATSGGLSENVPEKFDDYILHGDA
jgi:hypothetical protein